MTSFAGKGIEKTLAMVWGRFGTWSQGHSQLTHFYFHLVAGIGVTRHERLANLYQRYVDFKKAFDTVPRHILFQKLITHEITGKFYNSIKNMYIHDFSCINTGVSLTEKFRINQGVKQGFILSPLLFNIFISDLTEALDEGESNPVKINDTTSINSLIWADDLLLLSESEKGLNNMLANLHEYTKMNLIRVNLDKTNYMIFNKCGRQMRRKFMFGDAQVEMAKEYKYLGFLLTPSFNISKALGDLRDRGLKAYRALKTRMGDIFRKDISTTLHLYRTLIKPILLYASDFWGCLKLPKANPIETMHIKVCKDLLGVQIRTTNIGVLLELGEIPLCIFGKKNMAKNWNRISKEKKGNELLLSSYQHNTENDWGNNVKNYFSSIGLLNLFLESPPEEGNNQTARNPHIETEIPGSTSDKTPWEQIFNREKDMFQQIALHDLQTSSKLKTLALVKNDTICENYLLSVENVSNRTALTKFRLSNHNLMIEKGRHQNADLQDRTCPFCPDQIEDEFHFLLKCPIYRELRHKLFDDIRTTMMGFYQPQDEHFLFWFLLKNPLIANITGNFIRLAMELRAFLLENPRTRD